MLKVLIFIFIILIADCSGGSTDDEYGWKSSDKSNEGSSSDSSSSDESTSTASTSSGRALPTHQLVFTYPVAMWRSPYWAHNGSQITNENIRRYGPHNIENILQYCRIVRGNRYYISQIQTCLSEHILQRVGIKCYTDMRTDAHEQYLFKVEACFNRLSMALEDCNNDNRRNVCNHMREIIYDQIPLQWYTE